MLLFFVSNLQTLSNDKMKHNLASIDLGFIETSDRKVKLITKNENF